jgi:hypothetical protein
MSNEKPVSSTVQVSRNTKPSDRIICDTYSRGTAESVASKTGGTITWNHGSWCVVAKKR